eukprot:scaffold57085_cov31-Tisochrysis_lutea.AAC.3
MEVVTGRRVHCGKGAVMSAARRLCVESNRQHWEVDKKETWGPGRLHAGTSLVCACPLDQGEEVRGWRGTSNACVSASTIASSSMRRFSISSMRWSIAAEDTLAPCRPCPSRTQKSAH